MTTDGDLQPLLDRMEITDLIQRFSRCLDERDWQGYANTFTEDGEFAIFGQKRQGREAIAAGPAGDLGNMGVTLHFNTNVHVEIEGNEATAECSLLAVHVPARAEPAVHADVGGRYHYRCVRTPDGWRFRYVALDILWTDGIVLIPG